jgi:uncharacterized membrane protein YfcA
VRTPLTLVGIGLVAGFLAALFGVGGGVIVVPALVALLGFEIKRATATSLAAIGFTAVFGAIRYGISGHVHWTDAVLIGVPAIAGAAIGTRLQRVVSGRGLQVGFSLFMLATGCKLLLT